MLFWGTAHFYELICSLAKWQTAALPDFFYVCSWLEGLPYVLALSFVKSGYPAAVCQCVLEARPLLSLGKVGSRLRRSSSLITGLILWGGDELQVASLA